MLSFSRGTETNGLLDPLLDRVADRPSRHIDQGPIRIPTDDGIVSYSASLNDLVGLARTPTLGEPVRVTGVGSTQTEVRFTENSVPPSGSGQVLKPCETVPSTSLR